MKSNFKRYGTISSIDDIYAEMLRENFERRSVRELLPNQKDTRCVIGLYNILDDVKGFGNEEVFAAYWRYLYEVSAALKQEYGYSQIEYRSLMLVKLFAGCEIAEHTDEGGIYKYAHRVHIPIVTNEGCYFTVGGEVGRMAAGEIVEINNTMPHSVVNGDMDRVHLIVDVIGVHANFDNQALFRPMPENFYIEEV
jgi:hypothetical protein